MYNPDNQLLDAFKGSLNQFQNPDEDQELMEFEQDPVDGVSLYDSFYENLAEKLDTPILQKISSYLFDAIEEDSSGRDKLMETAEKVLKAAGITSIEDMVGDGGNTQMVPNTLRTFDSTFLSCTIRAYADTVSQLFPQLGPCGFFINGEKDQWGEFERIGAIDRDYINYYLTVKDVGYYPDAWRATLYTIVFGTGIKKVYHNPGTIAISRFIPPGKFIINSECSSILESDRITHELDLSKRTILNLMEKGIYKRADLPYLRGLEIGDTADEISKVITANNSEPKSYRGEFPIYECHTYLNLEEFTEDNPDKYSKDVPLPYVVTIDKTTKKVLSLRRNWLENDENKDRIEMFEVSNYLPGFGIYGMGLIHLIGSDAITLTKIMRALVDAGVYQNLPAGICAQGIKTPNKDFILGPGQFKEVPVAGSIRDAFMPLPFNGPSPALIELYRMKGEQAKELGSIADMGLTDTKDNVSPVTALAVMDHVSRIQSVALQSLHRSLSRELQMIWKVMKSTVDYEKFTFGEKAQTISKEHFIDEISIVPVADAMMNSRTQKMMKVQSLIGMKDQFPGLFKEEALARKMLDAMGMSTHAMDEIMYSPKEVAEKQSQAPQAIDPNELVKLDIEQKTQDTIARQKIAEGQQAAAIFKTETDLQIAAAKMQGERDNAERKEREAQVKNEMEQQLQIMREEIAARDRAFERELTKLKIENDRYKAELGLEETELKIEADKELAEFKASVEQVKQFQEKQL